jgi:hypothetical protein
MSTEPGQGFARLIGVLARSLKSLQIPAFCFAHRAKTKQFFDR